MLNNELNSLQEELNYHRQAIEELEAQIAQTKVYESFTTQASDAVEEAIKQIGVGKYLWLFKEHLMSLFPQEQPKYLEEKLPSAIKCQLLCPNDDNYFVRWDGEFIMRLCSRNNLRERDSYFPFFDL